MATFPDRSLSYRDFQQSDLNIISGFAANVQDLFFFFPKATFPLTPEQMAQGIEERSDPIVVICDDEVAGFADFYGVEKQVKCVIGHAVVDPKRRGQGIGKFLIESMIEVARQRHQVKEVHLACFHENVAGLLLYTKLGFVPYSIESRVDPGGKKVALIYMRRWNNDVTQD